MFLNISLILILILNICLIFLSTLGGIYTPFSWEHKGVSTSKSTEGNQKMYHKLVIHFLIFLNTLGSTYTPLYSQLNWLFKSSKAVWKRVTCFCDVFQAVAVVYCTLTSLMHGVLHLHKMNPLFHEPIRNRGSPWLTVKMEPWITGIGCCGH